MPAYAYPTAGANLGFKVGTQENVDRIITRTTGYESLYQSAVEGTFYLTSDTHRLYIGNNDHTLSPVNEGILKFANMAALRAALSNSTGALAGRFAYIQDENILAVHNGTQWIQINTFIDTKVTNFTNSSRALTDVSIVLEETITDNNDDTYTSRYVLSGANGTKVSVGTNTNVSVNGQTISVPTFVITGDTYTLSAGASETPNQVKIKLNSTNTTNDSEVTLSAGSNTTISRNNNVISFSSEDTKNASLTISSLSDGYRFTLTDTNSDTVTQDFKPTFKYGNNKTAQFDSTGTVTFDVYSKGQIDETIRLLNAMTYKGTLGTGGSAGSYIDATTNRIMLSSGGSANAVNTRIGDTFLTSSAFVYNGVTVPVGSLVIAKGTEDATTGYITSNYDYDIVASTINTDTHYKFVRNSTNNGVELIPVINGTEGVAVGELVFIGSGDITVSTTTGTAADGNGTKETVSVTHKAVTRANTTGTAVSTPAPTPTNDFNGSTTVSVVTGITSSATGHVTGVETTQITLTDSSGRITNQAAAGSAYVSNGKNIGVITQTVTESYPTGDTNVSTARFGINSDSLKIETDNTQQASATDATAIGGLKINMVWGNF